MPAGRPTKLNPTVQQRVCDAIRSGNWMETAAAFAGIDRSTLQRWFRRGEQAPKGIYRDFATAVQKATADAEARDVALIGKAAGEGNWQAAAWRLERRFPERWGRKDRIEATVHSTSDPVNQFRQDIKKLTDEELDALEKLYAKMLPSSGRGRGGGSPPAGGGAGAP